MEKSIKYNKLTGYGLASVSVENMAGWAGSLVAMLQGWGISLVPSCVNL